MTKILLSTSYRPDSVESMQVIKLKKKIEQENWEKIAITSLCCAMKKIEHS